MSYVSKHSQILQNILLDEYYENLIRNGASLAYGQRSEWEYLPHPYAFYESQGWDMNLFKVGLLTARTMAYILDDEPNNLYMHTRIYVAAETPYWHNYFLRYEITDLEREDYILMHSGPEKQEKGDLLHYKFYVQALFMNNEIAKSRTPEIIATSKIIEESQMDLSDSWQKARHLVEGIGVNFFLIDFDVHTSKISLGLLPRHFMNEYGNQIYMMCVRSRVAIIQGGAIIVTKNYDFETLSSPRDMQRIDVIEYVNPEATVFLPDEFPVGQQFFKELNYEKYSEYHK